MARSPWIPKASSASWPHVVRCHDCKTDLGSVRVTGRKILHSMRCEECGITWAVGVQMVDDDRVLVEWHGSRHFSHRLTEPRRAK